MSHDPRAPAPNEASQRGHASRMPGQPAWMASMLAGNSREMRAASSVSANSQQAESTDRARAAQPTDAR
jgi:hypothetical protein